MIFRSATGTGKTFAYLLPALQQILNSNENGKSGPALMVCAPTLELCSQIKSEIDFLMASVGARIIGGDSNGGAQANIGGTQANIGGAQSSGGPVSGAQCTGGPVSSGVSLLTGSVNLNRQIESLKKTKPIAVVGNPGRLLLLAKMGKLRFGSLRYLIFDEADRMTAVECRSEMTELVNLIAKSADEKQNPPLVAAACSATVSVKTGEFLNPLLRGAEFFETDEQEILRNQIEHWAVFSESRRKAQTLISFLAAVKPKKILVFTGRSFDAGKLVFVLQKHKISAAGLYSGMDKKERKSAIDRFRSGKTPVLVSSDLAARGLDIPEISHVAALDVSDNKDVYIHRAGRTARAGKRGIMVSIGDEIEMHRLASLEKKLGIAVHPKELYGGRIL